MPYCTVPEGFISSTCLLPTMTKRACSWRYSHTVVRMCGGRSVLASSAHPDIPAIELSSVFGCIGDHCAQATYSTDIASLDRPLHCQVNKATKWHQQNAWHLLYAHQTRVHWLLNDVVSCIMWCGGNAIDLEQGWRVFVIQAWGWHRWCPTKHRTPSYWWCPYRKQGSCRPDPADPCALLACLTIMRTLPMMWGLLLSELYD